MTSTAAEPGPYDPLEKAQPDEPVFTLVARDPHAPQTVLHWVDLARHAARDIEDESDRRGELQKCLEAEMIAWSMDRWRKGQPDHDTTTPARAVYNDTSTAAQTEDQRRRLRLDAALRHLREAAAEAELAREIMAELGEEFGANEIEIARNSINLLADQHAPKRPSFQPPLPMEQISG